MSIQAYVGLPGSGKSYSVVEQQVLPALRAGRKVVTNLPLILEEIDKLGLPGEVKTFEVQELVMEPHRILEYAVPGCIFILDEAWKLFPAGKQAVDLAEEVKSFLSEHRHMVDDKQNAINIVLCVQDLANMAAFARRLVENTFVTTKLSFVGLAKAFRVDVFHGAVTGCTPNPKKALRQVPGRYRKEIYSLYRSHTMSQSDGLGANEVKMDGRANVWMRPAFAVGVVVVPVLLWWSLHTLGRLGHEGFGGMHRPIPVGPGPDTPARSSAERGGTGPGLVQHGRVDDGVRVLFEKSVLGHPELAVVYIATADRVLELHASECRHSGVRLECLYQGRYYDGAGFVEAGPAGPVGPWVSPGVQGGGVSPPGGASHRDTRHSSS